MSLRSLAVAITDFFFADLDVEHVERVPTEGPVILAANHHSGLMDAMMLYATSPREVRAVAKSTLWKIWPLRPFLAAGRVIPVYRSRDGGGDNTNAFQAVAEAMGRGEVIGIFVEGTSHDDAGLKPVKTGAARMALDAVAAGAEPVVVPVGLIFEDRERFRSDALVRFGQPIDVAERFPDAAADDRESVQELTAEIEERLRIVAPSWSSAEERAAARSAAMKRLPVGASLGEVETEAERLVASGELGPPDRRLVGAEGEADLLVPPTEIDPLGAALVWPLAKLGQVTNLPPYLSIRLLVRRIDGNVRATLKSAAALVLFPVWWLLIALVSWSVIGSLLWAFGIAAGVALLGVIAARELPLARDERRTRRYLRSR